MERCPPELGYINNLKKAGIVLNLADYRGLSAINRDDLILWGEAEAQRLEDEQKLREQGIQKGKNL